MGSEINDNAEEKRGADLLLLMILIVLLIFPVSTEAEKDQE